MHVMIAFHQMPEMKGFTPPTSAVPDVADGLSTDIVYFPNQYTAIVALFGANCRMRFGWRSDFVQKYIYYLLGSEHSATSSLRGSVTHVNGQVARWRFKLIGSVENKARRMYLSFKTIINYI